MISQEEVTVRLGLDTRDFERRLREADSIAKRYARSAGSALNQGTSEGGHVPVSWQNASQLSKQSQELIKRGGGAMEALKQSAMSTWPVVGQVAETIAKVGLRSSLILLPVGMAVSAIQMMKSAFHEVKEASDLDVSVSFLRRLSVAADMAGESADEAKNRILRFQQVIAAAAEGNKEALAKLGRVGIKDPTGKTLEENLRDVANGLGVITDKAQQAKAAVELFGKGAQTSMPDILSELATKQGDNTPLGRVRANREGVKRETTSALQDENAATLAEGWKIGKRVWNTAGPGGQWRNLKFAAESMLAASLEKYLGVKGEVQEPSKLEAVGDKEAKAKAAKQREKELADARRNYNAALRDSMSESEKISNTTLDLLKTQEALRKGGLDELETLKLQTTELKLQKELAALKESAANKQLALEKQMAELLKRQRDIEQEKAQALRDRSGWTLGDVAGLGKQFDRDADGLPILPEDMLQSIERALGRTLGGGEIQEMRRRIGGAASKAGDATNLEGAAKWMNLLGLGNVADEMQKRSLGIRAGLNGLSSGESDPMAAFAKSLSAVKDDIGKLVELGDNKGLAIRPRMGK